MGQLWGLMFCMLGGCVASGAATGTSASLGALSATYSTRPTPSVFAGNTDADATRAALAAACERAGLTPDGRLAELARSVAEASGDGSRAPSAALVSYHARRLGLVEPTPQIWMAAGDTQSVLSALDAGLVDPKEDERPTHCGGGNASLAGGMVLVVALSRRLLSLDGPLPRSMESPGKVRLRGKLVRGYDHASLAITGPTGAITRVDLAPGRGIAHDLMLQERGEHTVELLARGAAGTVVVAITAIAVGTTPVLTAPGSDDERPERSPAELVQTLSDLIAEERAKRGLTALTLDARFAQVALAHSEDMKQHHFVAHTSPTTGDVGQRVMNAGLRASVLLENIGRGYSAREIHVGLMESPGHRANILQPDVRVLGVRAVSEREGERLAFLITELFARLPQDIDTRSAPRELSRAISQTRADHKLPAVRLDAVMSQAAQRGADRFAGDTRLDQRALLQQTARGVGNDAPRDVAELSAALVQADELGQVVDNAQLLDKKLSSIGIGIAHLPASSQHALVIVLVLGLSR